MAYTPIVTVSIAINTVRLTRVGFGTPLFVTSHNLFDERVVEVSSPEELITLGFETTDNAYAACQAFFSQSPSPTTVKIGRRSLGYSITLTDFNSTLGTESTHTFTVNIPSEGYSQIFSETAVTGETQEDLLGRLYTSLTTDLTLAAEATISPVTGTGTNATLTILPADSDKTLTVESTINVSAFETSNESVTDSLIKLSLYDDDWYFLTADDHTAPFVTDAASYVNGKDKLYFTSSSDETNLVQYQTDGTNSDLFGQLADLKYLNTVVLYHHSADTDFPECAYVAANATYDPGSVTWANLSLSGVDPSRVGTSVGSRYLNTNERGNLMDKSANYIEFDAGVSFTREGKTVSGEWIDVVRGVHWQKYDMASSLKTLLLNQRGSKVPYTGAGIAQVRDVMSTSLQRGVNRGFLESYTLTLPEISQISAQDKLDRILNNVKFTGVLAGAIHVVGVQGSVTV